MARATFAYTATRCLLGQELSQKAVAQSILRSCDNARMLCSGALCRH